MRDHSAFRVATEECDGTTRVVTTRFFTPPLSFFPPSPTLTTVKVGDGGVFKGNACLNILLPIKIGWISLPTGAVPAIGYFVSLHSQNILNRASIPTRMFPEHPLGDKYKK